MIFESAKYSYTNNDYVNMAQYFLGWPCYQHTEIIEISDNFSTNIGLDSTKVYACTL